MPSYFQTALMLGNAVQHAIDTKKLSRMTYESNIRNAEKLSKMFGWNKLGAGYFSMVYDNPYDTETVFKVNIHKQDKGPDAWIDYAAWCMRHSDEDPHFLKVHEIAVFPECFVAIMEKLEEADEGSREILTAYHSYKQCPVHLEERVAAFRVAAARVHSDIGLDDLHGDNIMRRGQQIVITDPVYVRKTETRFEDYVNDQRVERQRTTLAGASALPAIRPEAQDKVLRERPKHDNLARPQRIFSPLFPLPGSRRVQSASYVTVFSTDRPKEARLTGATGTGNVRGTEAARRQRELNL